MFRSTMFALWSASPFASSLGSLSVALLPLIREIGQGIVAFRTAAVTSESAHAWEKDLQRLLREVGRVIVEWVFNRLDPERAEQAPEQIECDGGIYRRRERSPRRGGIGTLFGVIALGRIRYEPCDTEVGLTCVFPLERRLGLVFGKATLGLAERIGQWTAQHTQATVRRLLGEEHRVAWSIETIRNVAAALRAGLAPLTAHVEVEYLLALLHQAAASKGPHRPVLSVGRDGVFVPLRHNAKYREASTATVAVLDRSGKRLGTVYLGQMPEAGQGTLSRQLTELLTAVLRGWHGALPRLQYVTDGGHHPTEYFGGVLRVMLHPRTGARLAWEWVLDYYHACLYVTKLAESLFGKQTQEAAAWAAKMRRWLRDKKSGILRVLHSAAAHAWRLERLDWSVEDRAAYDEGYGYLTKRRAWMDYWSCRRRGLAIGSGITEAACKTLFTQRFKQSGMKWSLEGGQVVVDLRAIWISKLWQPAFRRYVTHLSQSKQRTDLAENAKACEMAA